MSYYKTGGVSFTEAIEKGIDRVKKVIREEAAKGAAPAAKKSVTPYVVGAIALSALSLVVALKK
jgi:hypothetical protein